MAGSGRSLQVTALGWGWTVSYHSDPRDRTVPRHVGLGFPHTAYVLGRPAARPCAPAPSIPPWASQWPCPVCVCNLHTGKFSKLHIQGLTIMM